MNHWKEQITAHLERTLRAHSPGHSFEQVLLYATLPAGKLFRSLLVYSVANDTGGVNSAHQLLASSIEIHHAYTLVHDDLPSMDNDHTRRGRPTTHIQFGEWKAILAGDALLGISLSCLHQLPVSKLPWMLKFYGHCTGAKGLILGQCLDMSGEMNHGLIPLLETHKLKTSRLIQLALVGAVFLNRDLTLKEYKKLMRMGQSIGIAFQLLDDYQELSEELGEHEKEINPFLKYGKESMLQLTLHHQQKSIELCREMKMPGLEQLLQGHYLKFKIN